MTYPWSGTGVNYEYAYDRYGNRWNQTLNQLCNQGVSVCIKFDQYNHVTGGPLSYDAAGNVINDGNHTYTYDAANHLTGVGGGGTTASYAYDGSGQRVAKTVNGTTVQDLYDLSGHVVIEENAAGQWNRGEVYAGGQHLATYRSDKTYFSAVDALGTERMSATVDQTSNESCMNLPFGDDLTCTGTAVGEVSPLHFTGKERDSESGLDNFEARYFSSQMGRMMSPDPENYGANPLYPQSWNMYSYAMNNPLSFTDPFGLDCVYLNDAGNGVDPNGIDHDSNQGECNGHRGYWANGYIGSSNDVQTFSNTNTALITSTVSGITNVSLASQNETQGGFGLGNIPPSFFSGQFADPSYFSSPSLQDLQIQAMANGAQAAGRIIPTVCGGGIFGFLGAEGEHGFAGGLAEYDSNSGGSGNLLVEGEGKNGTGGGAYSSNPKHPTLANSTALAFVPVTPAAGAVGFASKSGVGVVPMSEATMGRWEEALVLTSTSPQSTTVSRRWAKCTRDEFYRSQ